MSSVRRTVRSVVACTLVSTVVAACAGSNGTPVATTAPPTTVGVTLPAGEGGITWTRCGAVECGTLDVPASHLDPAGPVLRIALYRRAAPVSDSLGTLLLVPDFDGRTARQLAEQASVAVGPAARSFDVVAVSPRGYFDSSALPCGTETEWTEDATRAAKIAAQCVTDRGDVASSYGLLDSADDVQTVVESLGVSQVKAVGWGRGATILAAWKMTHPASSTGVVLDSPDDPGIAPSTVASLNRAASDAGTAATLLWCSSHLSCPLVENSTRRVQAILGDIRNGLAGSTSETHFRYAFTRAMAGGDYGGFFRAMFAAENFDFAPLAAFADTAGSASEASFAARIAATCGDLSDAARAKVVEEDGAFETEFVRTGAGATAALVCSSMPPATRPLDRLKPVAAARGASMRVYVARTDGITSADMVKAFADRMDWAVRLVRTDGHLVVGRDMATTNAVSRFLAGE